MTPTPAILETGDLELRLRRLELDEAQLLRLLCAATDERNDALLGRASPVEIRDRNRLLDRLVQRASLVQAGVRATRHELARLEARADDRASRLAPQASTF